MSKMFAMQNHHVVHDSAKAFLHDSPIGLRKNRLQSLMNVSPNESPFNRGFEHYTMMGW